LGLPADCPLIVTGHAPHVPHPGVLAKYIGARALADQCGGAVVNLVIDTGVERVGGVEVPLLGPDGLVSAKQVRCAVERDGVLAMRGPADVQPRAMPASLMPQAVGGLASIWDAWERAEGATAATQAADMVGRLLEPHVGVMQVVYASRLLETPLGRELMDAARSDPKACVDAYNAAAGAGRVRPLEQDETPFWVVEEGVRRRATVVDLSRAQPLLPTALVTTAIARTCLADVFVHGFGGWSYDRSMEAWVQSWLGWTPAAAVMATATVPLASDLADQAIQTGRQARHDPAGNEGVSDMKQEWLRKIESLPRGGSARREAFKQMHAALSQVAGAGERDVAVRASAAAARRRDWAFPFYVDADLEALPAAIIEAAGLQHPTCGEPCPGH